jgi:hypothetical protein
MVFFIKGFLNIDTNTAPEKYSSLYINVFLFSIYNVG